MHKKIKFNGTSSEDLGLVLQTSPAYYIPERNYTYTSITGRNGDVITDGKSFKNVKVKYSLAWIIRPGYTFSEQSSLVASWLSSANGYARLEDDYDCNVYRLASVTAETNMSNVLDQASGVSIEFNCKPQRFFKSGEIEHQIGEWNGEVIKERDGYSEAGIWCTYITNPTKFTARPVIMLYPLGEGETDDIRYNLNIKVYNIPNKDKRYLIDDNMVTELTIENLRSIQNYNSEGTELLVKIDSELQEFYYIGKDTASVVDTIARLDTRREFPVFKKGVTAITFQCWYETINDSETQIGVNVHDVIFPNDTEKDRKFKEQMRIRPNWWSL